jgi:hypothetical protein
MVLLMAGIVIFALAVGWVAGMWTRRRTNVWCTACGHGLQCLACARVPAGQ